jgi:hypothetical protein
MNTATATIRRADALAERLELGAKALLSVAATLTDAEWAFPLPEGRPVGVVIHHVATVYPIEVQFALAIAYGKGVPGIMWADVHEMNARHRQEFEGVPKEATLDLLRRNSQAAAEAIRALTEEQLAQSALIPMYGGAPLTAQFVLEDHAVRHSYHHLAAIRRALGK